MAAAVEAAAVAMAKTMTRTPMTLMSIGTIRIMHLGYGIPSCQKDLASNAGATEGFGGMRILLKYQLDSSCKTLFHLLKMTVMALPCGQL